MADLDYAQNLEFGDDVTFIEERVHLRIMLADYIEQSVIEKIDRGNISSIEERRNAWNSLQNVAFDLVKEWACSAVNSNTKFNNLKRDLKSGQVKKNVCVFLPWYCWYDKVKAKDFWQKSGLSNRKGGVKFREYVGIPGEWHATRQAEERHRKRVEAHGVKIDPEVAYRYTISTTPEITTPTDQPHLTQEFHVGQTAHFSNRQIERILGREQEEETLRRFLDCEGGFRWLQIAGEGGQGKSRLAHDLGRRLISA